MKTERRHDLETNSLALKLTHWIESVKPHSRLVLGLVSLVVVLLVISSTWSSYLVSAEKVAWDAFALARNTTDPELMAVQKLGTAEEYAGTRMQEWAQITWADRQVTLAAGVYLRDREAAQDRLRGVIGLYDGLATNGLDQQIQNRARFGLARVYELQNKVEQAALEYALVEGDLAPMASERAKQLQTEDVKESCNWLATAELPKLDLTGGQGATGVRPNFDALLPVTSTSDEAETAEEDAAGE